VLKGKVKGIGKDDFVIIWGGGIYNWFDPLTLVKAMKILETRRKDIKLYFMGIKHPNPEVKELEMAGKTVELARKLGLEGKNIFFNFDWVDYDKRQNYLIESDAGIITHPGHIETRFSFRTRILDYLWTSLPIISTEGDHLSDIVKARGMGLVTSVGSAEELAEAMQKLADDKKFYKDCIKNIEETAGEFTWEKVCRPIIDFCADPVSNALKDTGEEGIVGSSGTLKKNGKKRSLMGRFFYHLFHSGPGKTAKYVSNHVSRK
jgi:glycosyltransferase involved in cell wall biosynthesis